MFLHKFIQATYCNELLYSVDSFIIKHVAPTFKTLLSYEQGEFREGDDRTLFLLKDK